MKVYVLKTGNYESECIIGTFSSIKQLEKFKNKFPEDDDYYDLEEFELDYIPDISEGKMIYYVYHNYAGKIKSYKTDISHIKEINILYGNDRYATYVWASSGEEAIDISKKLYIDNKLK